MGQRLLTLRVRPARIAVLISSRSSPADFVLVVRFLSQIWGGRYNPILPVDPDNPDALTAFRLGQDRPDFVFGLNLDNTVWKPAVHRACQPRQYVHLDQRIAEDVRKADRLSLIHSDRAIIAKFEARARPSAIVRPLKTISVDASSDLWPYCASMFGIHPENVSDKYRDEQHSAKSTTALDLIHLHKDLVDGWKESWLDAGSYGLSPHHMLSPPVEPTIVVVKDTIQDLSLFWNLRRASDTSIPHWVIPVPESHACRPELQQALSEWLLAFTKYGNEPNYCVMTSVSVSKESIQQIANGLQTALAGSAIQYIDYEPPKNRLPQVVAFEYTTTWPAELQGRTLTVIPPAPKVCSALRSSEAWFVDILRDNKTGRAIRDIQLPESTVIPELLNGPCPPSFEHTIVPRFGDGVDSINFHCNSRDGIVHFYIPTAREVLEETLREHGYEVIRDEKRTSYLPTIKRFGGLHMAASAMSGQSGEVLEILRSGRLRTSSERAQMDDDQHQSILIAQGHALSPRQINSIGRFGNGALSDTHFLDQIEHMFTRESDRVKRIGMIRFRRYAHRQIPDEMTLQALLEHWADRSVLKRKWQIGPCSRCGRRSFVGGIDLRKPPRCQHCQNHVPMRERTGIAYSLEPSVRHSLSEGVATVVLTGRFLRNMTTKGFFWLPGVKYQRADLKGDIDIFSCCDGCLVFGECKKLTSTPHDARTWDQTVDQFLKLASVATECGGDLVVLAAMIDAFPEKVQNRIESELSGRIPFLLLTMTDLENGHRPAQSDKEWPWANLHDLLPTRFPEPPMEKRSGPRRIEHGWGVFTKGAPEQPNSEDT